jgi:hypothetical protein
LIFKFRVNIQIWYRILFLSQLDCCLMQTQQFFSYIMLTIYFFLLPQIKHYWVHIIFFFHFIANSYLKARDSHEPVIANLVFNMTSKFHRKISADSFFIFNKFSTNSESSYIVCRIKLVNMNCQKKKKKCWFSTTTKKKYNSPQWVKYMTASCLEYVMLFVCNNSLIRIVINTRSGS